MIDNATKILNNKPDHKTWLGSDLRTVLRTYKRKKDRAIPSAKDALMEQYEKTKTRGMLAFEEYLEDNKVVPPKFMSDFRFSRDARNVRDELRRNRCTKRF